MAKTSVKNTIRKLRFAHGEMTQQQLAEEVGVTRQTIVAIEKEKYSPSLEVAFKIAIALDSGPKLRTTIAQNTDYRQSSPESYALASDLGKL